MSFIEGPRLPLEHVTALRSIDRYVYGGTHGRQTIIAPYGLACVGVIDGDYAGVAQAVNRLKPGRDVVALESRWYEPEHDDQWFTQRLREICDESTLLNVRPFHFGELARQAREGWVFSPHDYAYCLALERGVRVEYADASGEDRLRWLALRQRYGYKDLPGLYEESAFREVRMAERLGAIAVTMQGGRGHGRAKLVTFVGDDHTRNIKDHLKSNGVYWTKVRRYSPDLHKRRAHDIRYIAADQDVPLEERWIENAQRVSGETQ